MASRMKWCDRRIILSPYYYGLCQDEDLFKRELKRLGVPVTDWPSFLKTKRAHATTHFFESETRDCVIVCLGDCKGRSLIEVYGLLIHEAVHIWQAIHESIGERSPSLEFEAYAVQAISQELMAAFVPPVRGLRKP